MTVTEYGFELSLAMRASAFTGLVCLLRIVDFSLPAYWERNVEEILRTFRPSNFGWATR